MAIKVGGTTVIDDSRALSNIASVDATTVTALSTAGAGLPSQTGNTGKVLTTNGSAASWTEPGGGSYEVISDTMYNNVGYAEIDIIQDAMVKVEFTKLTVSTGMSLFFNFRGTNSTMQQVKYGVWRMRYANTTLSQSSSSWTEDGRVSDYQFNTSTHPIFGFAEYYKATGSYLKMNGRFYNDDSNDPGLEHFAMNTGTTSDLDWMRLRTNSGNFSVNVRVLRET